MPLFLKIIASVFLLISIVNPKIGWKIFEARKYINGEQSEVYLIITRIIAIAFLSVIWLHS